ncbi:MAG: hypothetical protein QM770_09290 [Tepidisphaeraceae bacterium]
MSTVPSNASNEPNLPAPASGTSLTPSAGPLPMPMVRPQELNLPGRRRRQRNGGSGGGKRGRSVPSGLSPRDLLFVIFKFKRRALGVAASILALALLATVAMPSKYRSEAELKVNAGRETIGLAATAGIGSSQLLTTDFNRQVETEAAVLRSHAVAERTVRDLGLGFFNVATPAEPTKLDHAIATVAGQLENKVDVTAIKNTQNLAIAYEAKSPADAQKLVEAWVNSYLAVRSESMAGSQTARALEKQSTETRDRLAKINEQILSLKKTTGVSDPEVQKSVLQTRIANLQTEIDKANADLAAAIQTVNSLDDQLAQTPRQITTKSTKGAPMGTLDAAQSKLAQLRQDLAVAQTKYLPDSTPVKMLQEQIAAQEKQVEELRKGDGEVETGPNPTFTLLEGQMKNAISQRDGLESRIKALVADKSTAQKGFDTLNEVDVQMKQLALEANVTEETLKKLRQGLDSARTDESLSADKDASDVSVYQTPTYNEKPVAPNRLVLLVGGLFAAGACGAAQRC